MFVVIFEVKPKPDHRDDYLREAGLLRPELVNIDGYVSNERYSDLKREGYVLSLSMWQNEKALIRWRTLGRHHLAQEAGRSKIFADYHLRVGELVADSGLGPGETLPQSRFDETEIGTAKYEALSEGRIEGITENPSPSTIAAALGGIHETGNPGLVEWAGFRHLLRPDDIVLLTAWRSQSDAEDWLDVSAPSSAHHRIVRVIRDYGRSRPASRR